MDIGGALLGGLGVEALAGAMRIAQARSPWGRSKDELADLRRKFQPTADQLATTLVTRLEKKGITTAQQARIADLLREQEAQTFIEQMMLVTLTGLGQQHRAELREQLNSLLALKTDMNRKTYLAAGQVIYEVFARLCDDLIARARETRRDFATIRDEAWNQLILESLRAIPQLANSYRQYSLRDLQNIATFERAYKAQVRSRHRFITPPHLEHMRRVAISKLFVEPRLRQASDTSDLITGEESFEKIARETLAPDRIVGRRGRLTLASLEGWAHRAVLLGDPGGGKSTVAQKLVYDLSREDGAAHCPIYVVLKDYAALEADGGMAISEFIQLRAQTQYEVPAPDGAVEYLLLTGRGFVVFDGLDELLDTSRRHEIVMNVETFSNRYPHSSIIVTSRRVGYNLVPLDPNIFASIELDELDREAVADYAHKWFSLDTSRPKEERKNLAEAFLRESSEVADIRSNPLLLGLLCNIYRAENYIPSSRAEVYKSCSTMLFEKWDSRRGIRVDLPYRKYLDPAVKYLAYWIFSDESLQSGITETQLVKKTVKYLSPDRIENEDEALEVARAFIAFCKGRAWVFTDTGTTSTGTPLYQFTHRTFLEFFAASYLVRISHTAGDLWKALGRHIRQQEWDVVSQLSLQIQEDQSEGAAADFLGLLLDESEQEQVHSAQQSLLSFASRSLHWVVPGETIARRIVYSAIDFVISVGKNKALWGIISEEPIDVLAYLLSVTNENRGIVRRGVIKHLTTTANSPNSEIAAGAIVLILNLDAIASFRSVRSDDAEWEESEKRILAQVDDPMPYAEGSLDIALSLYRRGGLPLAELVRLHGARALFEPLVQVFSIGSGSRRRAMSVAERVTAFRYGDNVATSLVREAREFGRLMRRMIQEESLPILPVGVVEDTRMGVIHRGWSRLPTNHDEAFAHFVILAMAWESESRDIQEMIRVGILPTSLMRIAEARASGVQTRASALALRKFRDSDSKLIRSWMAGEVSFLRPPVNDVGLSPDNGVL